MTSVNEGSAKNPAEAVPIGKVNKTFLDYVERHQQKKFESIELFDISLLRELIEKVDENDIRGEVEILTTSRNLMKDGTTAGLLVIRYNCDQYLALAGVSDHD